MSRSGQRTWAESTSISILKTEDEFWRDLDNEGGARPSENEITDVPDGFKDWVRDNADRIEAAEKRGTQPYFIRDNKNISRRR